jgi:predicted RNase H-like HicB family nuclease
VERKNMKTTAARTEPAPMEIGRGHRHFVYYCPNLDLWALGRTREEAETTLREEIRLLLAKCRRYLDSPLPISGNGYATVEIRTC